MNIDRITCPSCNSPWYVTTEDHKMCFCTSCGATWHIDRKPYISGDTHDIQIREDSDGK